MVEKCDTPECLRGVTVKGDLCLPCQKGMPPMKNPKSPHSYTSKTSVKTPALVIVTGKESGNKTPQSKKDKKTPQGNWKKNLTGPQIAKLQRKAVELIFSSYWYGWPQGMPEAFKDMFHSYGVFSTGREVPSKMVGTPDVHRSQVNVRGHPSFVLVMDAIFPMEGERQTFRMIENSPAMKEALGGVSASSAIEMVKNHGKTYTFTKNKDDGSEYRYVDEQGTTRMIPRWAIA